MKILIADDEFLARQALKHILEKADCGFEVVASVKNAEEAFEEYKKCRPDIVITDICMTGTDGLDLIEDICDFDKMANIIVLSAYDKFDYAKRAYESGAISYLLKPIDENEIISKLLDIRETILPNEERETARGNIPNMRERYFKDIVLHPFNKIEGFEEMCKNFGLVCADKFVLAKIYPNGFYRQPEAAQKNVANALYETMKYFSGLYMRECVVLSMSECEWVMICFFAKSVEVEQVQIHINELFMSLQEQYEIMTDQMKISVGVSGIYENANYMNKAYDEACEMLLSTAWIGKGSIVNKESESGTNQKVFMTKSEAERICNACIKKNEAEAIQCVNSYFQRIKSMDCVEFVLLCNAVSVAIINIANNTLREDMIYQIFNKRSNIFFEVTQCENIYDMKEWFKYKIYTIIDYARQLQRLLTDKRMLLHHSWIILQ